MSNLGPGRWKVLFTSGQCSETHCFYVSEVDAQRGTQVLGFAPIKLGRGHRVGEKMNIQKA
jgi:hypothetical protein